MLLNGTKTSSVIKGVVADLHHLKKTGGNSIKFSRKNDNVRPFEGGGETSLEFLSQKTDCSLFVVSTFMTKRLPRSHSLFLKSRDGCLFVCAYIYVCDGRCLEWKSNGLL